MAMVCYDKGSVIREDDTMAGQPIVQESSRRRWWRRRPSLILTLAVAMAVVLQLQVPRASADSKRVRLEDLRFSPERIEVSVGDTVVWKAEDDRHTVTARNGEFDSSGSGLMREGDEFRWRFRNAGTYPYFCRVDQYQGMQGEVAVLEDPAARAAAFSSTTSSTRRAPQDATTTVPSSTTTSTQPSTTTTSRLLATSSTVNLATTTTGMVTEPVTPHEAPTVDPDVESGAPAEASLPDRPAILRRHRDTGPSSATGVGLMVGLPAAAAAMFVVSRRRRRRRGSP
jgi:plastocyanin